MATNLLPLILLGGGAALLLGSKKKSGSSGGGSANGPKSPNGGNGKPASEVFGDIKWNKIRLDRSSAEGKRPDGAPDSGSYQWLGPFQNADSEGKPMLPIPPDTPVSAIRIGGTDELELAYKELAAGTGYTVSLANLTLRVTSNPGDGATPEGAEILSEVHSQIAKDPVPEGVDGGGGGTRSTLFRPTGLRGEALLVVEHTPPARPKEAVWAILVMR